MALRIEWSESVRRFLVAAECDVIESCRDVDDFRAIIAETAEDARVADYGPNGVVLELTGQVLYASAMLDDGTAIASLVSEVR